MEHTERRLHWEDFAFGESVDFGETRVGAEDIIAFAREFDPDPAHLDQTAASAAPAGGLTASDWHCCAMLMRMMCDDFLCRAAGAGAPGVEFVTWRGWVRPGDVLRVRRTALETRASRSRPRIGIVRMLLEVFNQRGERVMSWLPVQLYDRRDPTAEPPPPGPRIDAEDASEPVDADGRADVTRLRAPFKPPPEAGAAVIGTFEDIAVGEETPLGSYRFTTENMLGYATRFNPQYFHADEATAAASLYGGLIASGWHTGAVWNRLMTIRRLADEAAAPPGARRARVGPSISVRDMKWPTPVRPGDTVSFSTRVAEKVELSSNSDWGIVASRNDGINQRGETVLGLIHRTYVERRRPVRQETLGASYRSVRENPTP